MTIRELPAKVPRVPHGIRNANFKQERHAPKQTKSACRSKCYNLRVRSYSLMLARSRYFLSAGTVGEWLSLVEHLVRDQGVGGSNPLSPTIYSQAAHWISEDAILWISTIWVRLGPVSKSSTF